jgi:hypothetical protein
MYNSCAVLKEALLGVLYSVACFGKTDLPFGQILFCRILLQDNQVAADFRTCIFVNRLLGNRIAETKLLFSINALRIGSFFGLFKMPCEVMNACKPPSRSISSLSKRNRL